MRHPPGGAKTLVLGMSLWAATSAAQEVTSTPPRFTAGPVGITPTISTSFGVDTNVFNQHDEPQRDVITEVRPQARARLQLGWLRFDNLTSVALVHYRQFESERSANFRNVARLDMRLNRVSPWVSLNVLSTKERLNVEFDERVPRREHLLSAGVDVRAFGRTTVSVGGQAERVNFQEGSRAFDVDPRLTLNRRLTTVSTTVRHALTPLTSLVVVGEAQRARFDLSPVRNSTSLRVVPGLEFSPFALVSGEVYVGYRRFRPESAVIPPYDGVVASASVGYTLQARTRLTFTATRDVVYSVEPVQPYYLLGDLSGAVVRQVAERWQIGATVGRQTLAYRAIAPQALPPGPAVSTSATAMAWRFGGSAKYQIAPNTLAGITLDTFSRGGGGASRDYRGTRLLANITYGE